MSSPDPEAVTLFAKVMAGAVAVITPVWGGMKWLDGRLEKKADKAEVDRHRDYFVKVFEKMEEHQKADTEHFIEMRDMMHEHHTELLREIGRKADR